ncbi:hypothetical protein IAU60_000177 [Kwoniella sp. DSM 27419]
MSRSDGSSPYGSPTARDANAEAGPSRPSATTGESTRDPSARRKGKGKGRATGPEVEPSSTTQSPPKGKGKKRTRHPLSAVTVPDSDVDEPLGQPSAAHQHPSAGDDESNAQVSIDDLILRIPRSRSDRNKRGWETRRAKKRAKLENGLSFVHGREESVGAREAYDAPVPPALPTSELLLAIHHRAAALYTAHSLLYPPAKRGRTVPWGSKKRLLILQDAMTSGRSSHSSGQSRTGSNQGEGAIASPSPDETAHYAPKAEIQRIKHEYTDEYGEIVREALKGQPSNGGIKERKDRSKGKYNLRDMYRAIDGQGLMALGILVQEHIIDQLRAAGYRARGEVDPRLQYSAEVPIPPDDTSDDGNDPSNSSAHSRDSSPRHQTQRS